MRVLCAWCLKEGKPESEALIGEREPPGDDSHGICSAHRKEIEDRVAALRLEAERRREEAERQREEAERHRVEAEQQREEAERLRRLVDP